MISIDVRASNTPYDVKEKSFFVTIGLVDVVVVVVVVVVLNELKFKHLSATEL